MSEEISQRSSALRWLVIAAPLLVFGALAAIFFTQLTSGRDNSELPSALIGGKAPEFSLPALAGLKREGVPVPALANTDLKGGLKLVNIFASWCAPCRVEHPVLMELAKDKRLEVVGINYKDDPGNALRFLGALGNPYARVGTDRAGRIAIDWGFYGIPESLLVDADGIVRHKIIGEITEKKYQRLLAEIEKLSAK